MEKERMQSQIITRMHRPNNYNDIHLYKDEVEFHHLSIIKIIYYYNDNKHLFIHCPILVSILLALAIANSCTL